MQLSSTQAFFLGIALALVIFVFIADRVLKSKKDPSAADGSEKAQNTRPFFAGTYEAYLEVGNANTNAILANTEALREQTALLKQILDKQNQADT